MLRRPPRSTRTDTLFPYTTLFRSRPDLLAQAHLGVAGGQEAVDGHHARSAICEVATIGSEWRPEGSRCWVSSRMSRAIGAATVEPPPPCRSEEHTSELQSLMRISYAVFCLTKKTKHKHQYRNSQQ